MRRLLLGAVVLMALAAIPIGLRLAQIKGAADAFDMQQARRMLDPAWVAAAAAESLPQQAQDRRPIVLRAGEFPPALVDALVAREDKRFFRHGGVDWIGVGRAALANIKARRVKQGAGTITMQASRGVFGLRARTLRRKIIEAFVARRLEREFSKDEILALYLNWTFWGGNDIGAERAARSNMLKSARHLSPAECALLVGILRAPNRYDPVRNPQAAMAERDAVLGRMESEGMISAAEAQRARSRPPLPSRALPARGIPRARPISAR